MKRDRGGGGARPSASDVFEALVPICHKWKFIGIALRLDTTFLGRVGSLYSSQPEEALLKVVEEWLLSSPSWEQLLKALCSRTVGENRLAGEIEETYRQQRASEHGEAGAQLQHGVLTVELYYNIG